MELKTPTDGLIKNGELYGIRNAYAKMINESFSNTQKNQIFAKIYESVKDTDFDKLTKFAKKNAKLATAATKKAVAKARKCIDCTYDKAIIDEVCERVEKVITAELPKQVPCKVKKNKDTLGKLKPGKMMSITEDNDYDDSDYDNDNEDDAYDIRTDRTFTPDIAGMGNEKISPETLKEIDDFTKDVPYDKDLSPELKSDLAKNGIDVDSLEDEDDDKKALGRANTDDDEEEEDDDDLTPVAKPTGFRHMSDEFDKVPSYKDDEDYMPKQYFEYCVQSVRMSVSVGNKVLGKPVTLHFITPDDTNYRVQDLSDMEQVVDYINKVSGFYFDIDDFSYDFAKARNGGTPLLMAHKVITSDVVQGSKAFNKYFGPNGKYADYLYNADGTAKFSPDSKEAENASDAEKDVSVVSNYPLVSIGARIFSRNHKTKKERDIKPLDFRGTAIKVQECTEQLTNEDADDDNTRHMKILKAIDVIIDYVKSAKSLGDDSSFKKLLFDKLNTLHTIMTECTECVDDSEVTESIDANDMYDRLSELDSDRLLRAFIDFYGRGIITKPDFIEFLVDEGLIDADDEDDEY